MSIKVDGAHVRRDLQKMDLSELFELLARVRKNHSDYQRAIERPEFVMFSDEGQARIQDNARFFVDLDVEIEKYILERYGTQKEA